MYSNIEPGRVQSYVIASGVSDHFSQLTKIIDAKTTILSKQTIFRRKKTLSENEVTAFNKELEAMLKKRIITEPTLESIEHNAKHIISSYQSLIDKYMPLRKISNKQKKSLQKPWVTQGIKKSITIRDKLLKQSTKRLLRSLLAVNAKILQKEHPK